MPHITLECTANVKIDFQEFFSKLSESLAATGNAAAVGIKCRLVVSDEYYIADGNQDFQMVNLLFRLREGRTNKVLKEFSQIGMKLMEEYFREEVKAKSIILSTEIKELIKGIDLTKNAIRK